MKVFVGYDRREAAAYEVTVRSLRRRSSVPLEVTPLIASRLRSAGLLLRQVDERGGLYDLASAAPQATEFANSRFIVPLLAQTGAALFVDCDMVFLGDVAELLGAFDSSKAVQVVKHHHIPRETTKMDGVAQTAYTRKNWSSVVLWNCDHPANRRLTLDIVNNWPGRDLHAFSWLHDDEIGDLPPEWNWLVGVQPKPAAPRLAHFTLGGPWIEGWPGSEHDDIWTTEARA